MLVISNQKGNVLFLILIAVALFAALSYAVTQSNVGGGKKISEDKLRLEVDVLFNQIAFLRAELTREQLGGDIVHLTTNADGFYSTANARSFVFPPSDIYSPASAPLENNRIWEIDFVRYYLDGSDIGTEYNDQYLFLGQISQEACAIINEIMHGSENVESINWVGTPANSDPLVSRYSGTRKDGTSFDSSPTAPGYLNVYDEGCYEYIPTSRYYAMFKVVER